jgi:hypothetical protein
MRAVKSIAPLLVAIAAAAFPAAALASPQVTATVKGSTVTGTYTTQQPSFVVGLRLPAGLGANVVSLSCPGAQAKAGGPDGAWECLFSTAVTRTQFRLIGKAAWPVRFSVIPFESHDNATYVTGTPVKIGTTPAPPPASTSTSEPTSTASPTVTLVVTAPGSSLSWLWMTLIGIGVVLAAWGLWPREDVATSVPQPELPPMGGWGKDENIAIDQGILEGFAGMGKQDVPHTVSDDAGPATFNPEAPVTQYTPPSADAIAAERRWGQDRAHEREVEDDPLHHAYRTPNAGLRDLYDKLAQINQLIADLDGPQADTVALEDPLLTAFREATDFNATSFDPKEHAYKMRDQVTQLIQLYLNQGAEAVNKAIYQQKLEYMVNTVRMESDLAQGTAIAATGGALSSTQAGYAPAEGTKIAAPNPQSKGGASEPETGFAPEPETIKMTPTQQGIKPGASGTPTWQDNPVGMDTESPTVHDNPLGMDTESPTVHGDGPAVSRPVPDADVVTFEAGRIERTFKGGDAYAKQQYGRFLQEQPPEWWDKIQDPETKAYLEQILNALK